MIIQFPGSQSGSQFRSTWWYIILRQ